MGMTKSIRFIVVVLLVASTVMAVFGPVTQAQTPEPVKEPETMVRPALTPQATGLTAADVKVAVVAGGPHPYFAPMEFGAADAKAAFGLGAADFKVPQDWNLNTSNQLLNSLVAQGYNSFASWPADANASNATFDELVGQSYPVISTAACINQPTSASFCLATDVGHSAYLATKALIEQLGGKGKIMHGTGYLKDLNTQKRMAAVEKAVAETNGAVELVQHIADIDDQEAADRAINSFLAANADKIDGIVTTAYVPSVVSATALRNLGDKRIKMVGIDDDKVVLDAIRDGYVYGTMSQNPYGQAYISAKVLADLKMGCVPKQDAPFHIDSGTLLITAANVDTYDEERKALTREITASFREKYLDCPEGMPADKAPEKPAGEAETMVRPALTPQATGLTAADVKVAVVAGGPHPYFAPMEFGAADAKAAFGLGAADFKVPQDWNLNTSNQLLNSLVAQGYNSFASWPADANASNATFDELVGQSYPVISTAACINQPTSASFCLATDVGHSAYLATKALIEQLGGKGKIMHGTGYLKDLNTQKRMAAVEKAVAETNGAVELVQHIADIDDQEAADRAINSFLAANADKIDGIVTTAYVPSVVSATALRNLGDKRIKMVGIDDDKVVLDAIRDGYVYGTMSQNPYGQAYISAKVLADLKMGCVPKQDAPFHIDSGTLLITAANVDTYDEERKALTREITASFREKYLVCPENVQ